MVALPRLVIAAPASGCGKTTVACGLMAALRARGVRCDLVLFDGEGHGFRKAQTLARCAELEIAFVRDVLGIDGDG